MAIQGSLPTALALGSRGLGGGAGGVLASEEYNQQHISQQDASEGRYAPALLIVLGSHTNARDVLLEGRDSAGGSVGGQLGSKSIPVDACSNVGILQDGKQDLTISLRCESQ